MAEHTQAGDSYPKTAAQLRRRLLWSCVELAAAAACASAAPEMLGNALAQRFDHQQGCVPNVPPACKGNTLLICLFGAETLHAGQACKDTLTNHIHLLFVTKCVSSSKQPETEQVASQGAIRCSPAIAIMQL